MNTTDSIRDALWIAEDDEFKKNFLLSCIST